MTPRETLAKYGLASDVMSIKERIKKDDYSCISEMCYEQRTADLDLLCEMAEKVESTQATNKDLKNTISAIYQVSRKWFDDVHADGNDSMEEIKKILEGKE